MSHKAERRPGPDDIWLAVTKHDGGLSIRYSSISRLAYQWPEEAVKVTITTEDIQFHDRDFREHYDGVPCQAPGAEDKKH